MLNCVQSTVERKTAAENICQIMWPSVYISGLDQVAQRTVLMLYCTEQIASLKSQQNDYKKDYCWTLTV